MSKYNDLWIYISNNCNEEMRLSFDEIQKILGFPIDHSFLNYKKELKEYGYIIKKIELKNKKIIIGKL